MSRRPGYVLDTNTLVSAFLFRLSIPGRALDAAISGGGLLFSADTAQEIVEVIRRERFDRYVDRRKREDLLRSLLDDAECIVTGDDDLLVLNPFRDIPMVTPREFLESMSGLRQLGATIHGALVVDACDRPSRSGSPEFSPLSAIIFQRSCRSAG